MVTWQSGQEPQIAVLKSGAKPWVITVLWFCNSSALCGSGSQIPYLGRKCGTVGEEEDY